MRHPESRLDRRCSLRLQRRSADLQPTRRARGTPEPDSTRPNHHPRILQAALGPQLDPSQPSHALSQVTSSIDGRQQAQGPAADHWSSAGRRDRAMDPLHTHARPTPTPHPPHTHPIHTPNPHPRTHPIPTFDYTQHPNHPPPQTLTPPHRYSAAAALAAASSLAAGMLTSTIITTANPTTMHPAHRPVPTSRYSQSGHAATPKVTQPYTLTQPSQVWPGVPKSRLASLSPRRTCARPGGSRVGL